MAVKKTKKSKAKTSGTRKAKRGAPSAGKAKRTSKKMSKPGKSASKSASKKSASKGRTRAPKGDGTERKIPTEAPPEQTPPAEQPPLERAPGMPQPPMILKSSDPAHAPGHRRIPYVREGEENNAVEGKMEAVQDRFSKGDRMKIIRTNQRRQMNGRR